MPIQDVDGIPVFPSWGSYGHLVFMRFGGEQQRPYVGFAEIRKDNRHPSGWGPRMRDLKPYQLERQKYNPQISFPIEEVPTIIAALAKVYEKHTAASAPKEAKQYTEKYNETEKDREADKFVKSSSEF